MIPLIGAALASGALNLAGDIFTQTTARSAYKSRYQDEVNDLRKAGLNPALAYGANPGSPNTATFSGLGDAAMSGYQAAASARKAAADTEMQREQIALLKAQKNDILNTTYYRSRDAQFLSDLHESAASKESTAARIAKRTEDAAVTSAAAQAALQGYQLPEARAYAKYYGGRLGRAEPYLNQGLGTAKDAAGIIGSLFTGGSGRTVTHLHKRVP